MNPMRRLLERELIAGLGARRRRALVERLRGNVDQRRGWDRAIAAFRVLERREDFAVRDRSGRALAVRGPRRPRRGHVDAAALSMGVVGCERGHDRERSCRALVDRLDRAARRDGHRRARRTRWRSLRAAAGDRADVRSTRALGRDGAGARSTTRSAFPYGWARRGSPTSTRRRSLERRCTSARSGSRTTARCSTTCRRPTRPRPRRWPSRSRGSRCPSRFGSRSTTLPAACGCSRSRASARPRSPTSINSRPRSQLSPTRISTIHLGTRGCPTPRSFLCVRNRLAVRARRRCCSSILGTNHDLTRVHLPRSDLADSRVCGAGAAPQRGPWSRARAHQRDVSASRS